MTEFPVLGAEIPRRDGRFMRAVGRAVLRLLGWRVEGEIPNLPKLVIAVAPHLFYGGVRERIAEESSHGRWARTFQRPSAIAVAAACVRGRASTAAFAPLP